MRHGYNVAITASMSILSRILTWCTTNDASLYSRSLGSNLCDLVPTALSRLYHRRGRLFLEGSR